MASTYLSLTNTLLRRMNEVEIISADFSSARGVQALAKDAIKSSIAHINRTHFKWPWNADTGTQVLTQGVEEYDWPYSDLKLPDWNSFYIVGDASLNVDFTHLRFIDRETWMWRYRDIDFQSGAEGLGVPRYVFPKHNGGFGVSPSPNKAFIVTFDYWKDQATLSANTDTVNIPTVYDDIIVDGGVYYFWMYRDNRENAQLAKVNFLDGLKTIRSIEVNMDEYATDTRVNY